MSLLHDKISPLIDSQFPSFYHEEGTMFVAFVKEYYKWLEDTGNSLYHSHHLLDYADIDLTLDQFLPYYQAKYVPDTPTAQIQNQRDLIKHSADIYRTRGTLQSLRLVFQMLYNESIEVYYPGDDLLKPSDGKWVAPRYLEVTLTDRTRTFVGKDIVGVVSGARGFVERVDQRVHDGQRIDVVYLSNVVNNETTGSTFIAGELITDNGTHEGCPTVIGSLRAVSITNAGSGFEVGQIVDVVSSLRGKQGKARVLSVGALTGEVNYRLLDGGFGYTNNDTIFGSNTKVYVSSNVITTTAFTSPVPSVTTFGGYTSIVQPQSNIVYTSNTVAFAVGDLIAGANSTGGIIATGIILSANASGHMLVSPRTTSSIAVDTVALPSGTGSFALGELVYQSSGGANTAVGKVMLANSSTVVVDQRYGPFTTNTTIYGVTSTCTANAATVTTRAYTDLNFSNSSITKIYANENTGANASVSSATRMTLTASVLGANSTAIGIINPTIGGTATFNANTDVNGVTDVIATVGPAYHKFSNGDIVKYLVAAGNTAITGLSNNTNYYVVNTSNNTHLQLSSSFGGSAVGITAGSTSETGHTLTSLTTKAFKTGTNAYIHAAGNTSITAEAAVISTGYPGGFQIGQITDTEIAYLGTTLVGGANTNGQPLLGITLNAAAYGFPASPSANLSSVIGTVLSQQAYVIGTISTLTNRNPGYDNTAKPFVVEVEQAVAAYGKPSRSYLTLDAATTVGTFKIGETVTEPIVNPAVNVAITSINGTFSTNTRELVRQVRSDGVTTYGEIYVVDAIGGTARILVANTSNTFNTSNTIVSVANTNVNATPTAVSTLNVNTFAKGTILSITTAPGTVIPTELYIKQKSFQSFSTGGIVTGVESGSTSNVASVSGIFTLGVLGNDAIVDPESDISAGTIRTVEIADSGFFYKDGESVQLVETGNPITAAGIVAVDSIGYNQGFWRGDNGTLSSTKKIQDNEYYQEFSYEIRAGIDRTVYESAVKSLTHVAGTKMFNKFSKVSDTVIDVNATAPHVGPSVSLTLNSWQPFQFAPSSTNAVISNPNAYGTTVNDTFGYAIAMTDNHAIIGTYSEDDSGGDDSGKAYIFNIPTGTLLHTLSNPNTYGLSANDQFGTSVAISGNYAIVGAPLEDSSTTTDSGKAYVFDVISGSLLYTLTDPSPTTGNRFGGIVAAANTYAVVGVLNASGGGKAYVYDITTGALLHTLANPNAYGTTTGDAFGSAVSISGNYVIVSATFEDIAGGSGSGVVYVFNISTGILVHTLTNPNAYNTAASDYFGFTLSANGNYLAVGVPYEDDAGGSASGKVYVYNLTTGSLLFTLNNPNPYDTTANDSFGRAIAQSGSYLIVSAPGEDDASNTSIGKVYVYDIATGAFIGTVENPNVYGTGASDTFGGQLAASGGYLLAAAYLEDDAGGTDSGKVYIMSDNAHMINALVEQKVGGVTTASGIITSYDPINKIINLTNIAGTFTSPNDVYIGSAGSTAQFSTIAKVGKNL